MFFETQNSASRPCWLLAFVYTFQRYNLFSEKFSFSIDTPRRNYKQYYSYHFELKKTNLWVPLLFGEQIPLIWNPKVFISEIRLCVVIIYIINYNDLLTLNRKLRLNIFQYQNKMSTKVLRFVQWHWTHQLSSKFIYNKKKRKVPTDCKPYQEWFFAVKPSLISNNA